MDFGIWGRGGLNIHSQKPRIPLTYFGTYMLKLEGVVLVQGLVIQVWIAIKHERQGDGNFLKDSDGFWMTFQVLFGCDRSTSFGVITIW